MCTETLSLRTNEFAVDASWDTKAHIQPVFHTSRDNCPLVLLILLCSEQDTSIVITHNPLRRHNTVKNLC